MDSSSWGKMFKNAGIGENGREFGVPVPFKDAQAMAKREPFVITKDSLLGLQYRLDCFQKPKAIDLLLNGKVVVRGIYELQGDRLQFHLTKTPDRPESFVHQPNDDTDDIFMVLERANASAAAAEASIERLRRFDPGMRVGTIAFSPDGKRIAVGNDQPTMIMMRGGHSRVADNWQPAVRIVDAETGRPVVSLRLTTAEEDAALAAAERFSHFQVTSLAFSPDGTMVAVGTDVGQVKLFDLPTGGLLRSLDDEKAKLADKNTPEQWKSLKRAMGNVASLAFSPDGSLLAVCGSSFADYSYSGAFDGILRTGLRTTGPGRLKLWEVKTGTLKHDLAGHDHANAVAFSPDGNLLASAGSWMASSDGKTDPILEHGTGVIFWNLRSGRKIGAMTTSVSGWTRAVAFSPDGASVAVGAQHFGRGGENSSGRVSLAQVASGNVDWFQTVPGWAAAVAFSPDGQRIIVLCGRNVVRLLDANTGELQNEIKLTDFLDERGRYPALSAATKSHLLAIGGVTKDKQGYVEVWGFNAAQANAAPDSATSKPEQTVAPEGPVLTYEAEPSSASAGAAATDMDKLLKAIDQRLNGGPEKLAQVRKVTEGRIEVALMRDNDKDQQRVERLLAKPGTLEFRILANERDNKELIEQARKEPSKTEVLDASGKRLAWWVPIKEGEEKSFAGTPDIVRRTRKMDHHEVMEVLVVADPYNVTGAYLTKAAVAPDQRGKPCIDFTFNEAGGQLFAKLTGDHLPDAKTGFHYRLGIILDGELWSAPLIQSIIHGKGKSPVPSQRSRLRRSPTY